MKKQIDPPIKAHLPWSALMIRLGRASFLCSKYSPLRLKAFHREVMQRPGLPLIRLIVFGGMAVGLAALIAAGESTAQSTSSPALLQPTAATHETRADSQELIGLRKVNEDASPIESVSSATPTRSSFMATWDAVSDAKGYLLDVSASDSFSSYVDGYYGLDVGNAIGRAVTGLKPGTTYYYRVRPYSAAGSGGYLDVTTATTEAPTGLIIHPTFDSSITPLISTLTFGGRIFGRDRQSTQLRHSSIVPFP